MISSRQWRSERGLTMRELIFLLMVMICAASVIGPYLREKRNEKNRLVSFRNLQQWGIALNLHLLDNENQLPLVGSTPIEAKPENTWYNMLPTYLALDPLGATQKDKLPKEGDDSIWIDPSAEEPGYIQYPFFTYGMNRYLQPDRKLPSYTIFDLTSPGTTIFLTETAGSSPGVVPSTVQFRHTVPEAGKIPLAYVLFCDGHVAPASRKELLDEPQATVPTDELSSVSWVPFIDAPEPADE